MMSELERFVMTVSCRDSDLLPKVSDAGRISEHDGMDVQIMHNGLKVVSGGYHGDWMSDVIRSLQGHHEPQEELLFHHLLRYARQKTTFVELGAFWAYYTSWYLWAIPYSRAICIEPDSNNMSVGQTNVRLNKLEATFINACVGQTSNHDIAVTRESDGVIVHIPCYDMDAVLQAADGECIEILHMDVQGAEYSFISSMQQAVRSGKVRFLVVSTHHELISGVKTTHQDCIEEIVRMCGHILCEHSVEESYSGDGLIVASFFASDRGIQVPQISRNHPSNSLFGCT